MVSISNRLKAIASLVDDKAKIIDIGCDHALLDVYLIQSKKEIETIATDIRESALNQAKDNINKYNLKEQIELRLGNGLDVINKEDSIDTIVIAGMGGLRINHLLKNNKNKLKKIDTIITQPNLDIIKVRIEVCCLGYYIDDEILIKDNNIIYTIIKFKKGKHKYTKKEYLLGPSLMLKKEPIFIEWLKIELKKSLALYKFIPKKYFIKRYHLYQTIKLLEKELKIKAIK